MAKKQSTSFAQVATNLLNVLQGYTKGIRFVVVLTILLTIGIGQGLGAEVTFLPKELKAVTSEDYSHTKDNITIAVTASTVTADQFRIFKNRTITIISTGGDITSIKFTCTADGTQKYGPGCFTANKGEYSYSNNIGTWIGSATEIQFTASGDQVRATEIVVTYGSSCDKIVTVQAGKPIQGASFQLDKTGEQECCDDLTVTVSDIVTPSGYQFSAITQTGINSGVTIDQTNKIVTYAQNTSGTSTINVTFEELPKYTVTWSVDGNTTTEEVYSGKKPTEAPTIDPNDLPCEGADKFVGWTDAENGNYTHNTSKLYKTIGEIPAITGNITFYAVFADYAD